MMKLLTKEAIRRAAAARLRVHRMRTNESTPHGIGSMEQFLFFLGGLGLRPRCILDVGGNRTGLVPALAAKVFPDARFVLIEPQQEMLPFLNTFCTSHLRRPVSFSPERGPNRRSPFKLSSTT